MTSPADLVAAVRDRCRFPPAGAALPCAFSGGADSTALLVLALDAGCHPTAHHVDHRLRPESSEESAAARRIAGGLGVPFVLHTIDVATGPNLEARARAARHAVLPAGSATGHTLDDQAETVLINLLRGAGSNGVAAITPSTTKPLLSIRRRETRELCAALGIEPVADPSNTDPRFRRNRVRHELLPLLDDIAERDVTPLLARTADLCRDDAAHLDELAAALDPTDARSIAAAPPALARRALRSWLAVDGYPPDIASVERAMAVARGERTACEIQGGVRVARSGQRLHRSTTLPPRGPG